MAQSLGPWPGAQGAGPGTQSPGPNRVEFSAGPGPQPVAVRPGAWAGGQGPGAQGPGAMAQGPWYTARCCPQSNACASSARPWLVYAEIWCTRVLNN